MDGQAAVEQRRYLVRHQLRCATLHCDSFFVTLGTGSLGFIGKELKSKRDKLIQWRDEILAEK